eukprot:GFUD01070926.1.p1 GENE.GFUD01070926.1~~GFUD01070926.1.p1  ORF type:complete len:183 (-),score=24.78 GFUD01070926.1:205-708(-)
MRHWQCIFSFFLWIFTFLIEGTNPESLTTSHVAKQPECNRNRNGKIGESYITRCTEFICTLGSSGRKGYWKEDLARNLCCSHQQVSYQIGETMGTILAQDNCTVVTMVCAADINANAEVQMKTDTKCAKTGLEKLDEYANIVDGILKKQNLTIEDVTAKIESLILEV